MKQLLFLALIMCSFLESQATTYNINNSGDWVTQLTNAGVSDPLMIVDDTLVINGQLTIDGLMIELLGDTRIRFFDNTTLTNGANMNFNGNSTAEIFAKMSLNGSSMEFAGTNNSRIFGLIQLDMASKLIFRSTNAFLSNSITMSGGSGLEILDNAVVTNKRGASIISTSGLTSIDIAVGATFINDGIITCLQTTINNSGTLQNAGDIQLDPGSVINAQGGSTTSTCTPPTSDITDLSGGTATIENAANGTVCESITGMPTLIWVDCECVEPPVETFVVTNTNDSGPGSLRDAMTRTSERIGREIIDVQVGNDTIHLTSFNPESNNFNRLPNLSDVELIGNGVVLNANGEGRHFQIADNTVIKSTSFINGSRLMSFGNPFATTGSIFISSGRPCTIDGCHFENNEAITQGGVVRISNATATILNSTFIGNSSTNGGAIYLQGTLTITNCIFNENVADQGGALYLADNSTCNMNGSIMSNSMPYTGTGLEPGDIYIVNSSSLVGMNSKTNSKASTLTFANNVIERCEGDCPTFTEDEALMIDPGLGALVIRPGQTPGFTLLPTSQLIGSSIGAVMVLASVIPTIGQWALFILGLMLASLAVVRIRKLGLA